MTEREKKILTDRLYPRPREIKFPEQEGFLRLDANTEIRIALPGKDCSGTLQHAAALCRLFWNCGNLKFIPPETGVPVNPEGYSLRVDTDGLLLRASGNAGILNALKTLRQLAEPERGVLKAAAYELPFCTIEDEPRLAFRGLHICYFPENKPWQIERAVRLAAYLKFNYIVLETWGVFPFRSSPFLCWPDHGAKREDLKRIADAAKSLGATLIPQFNILGHASGSRENGGKHVVLNNHPEYAPLFEPDGWSFCISNPETRKTLDNAVAEMHEFFGNTPFFHAGCDEARLLGTCRSCRKKELKTLVHNHLMHFHDLLAARGARMMIWHDMLLNKEDPRWNGYTVCGAEKDGLATLLDELPKDIVICDWQYLYPAKKDGLPPDWPTSRHFKKKGFDTLVCPCGNRDGLRSLAELAAETPLMGMLETTWADLDTAMQTTFSAASAAAWHGGESAFLPPDGWDPDGLCFLHHFLRQMENDMDLCSYESAGRIMLQIPEKIHF